MSNEETEVPETPAEPGAAAPTKRKRDELPAGYVTPVGFANALKTRDGTEVRPQQIYGYLRNNNANFKTEVGIVEHSDGRPIMVLEQAFAWWDAKEARKEARTLKATEKAAADAAKASEPVNAEA